MAPTSYIKIKNGTTGAVRSILTAAGKHGGDNGYLSLIVRNKRNDIDACEFVIDYSNPDVAALADKDQIEIVRSDPTQAITEYTLFDGIYRDSIVDYKNGLQTFKARALGYNYLLSWRDIAWPASVTNRTVFSTAKAETILKLLVDYNIGANSLASNGRIVDGALTGFTIEADGAHGNTLSLAVSNENLLDALKKIVPKAGGDFAVVRTGATTFQFKWYTGQLGTDRSTGAAAVVFSLDRGNMDNPTLSQIRSAERTKAIIGGTGEDSARVFTTKTGPNYNASTNNIEMFVDGRNSGVNTTVLQGLGEVKLEELKFRNKLDYDVLQIDSCQIDKHYFLGDKITAVFGGVSVTQFVNEKLFEYKNANERVSVVMIDV